MKLDYLEGQFLIVDEGISRVNGNESLYRTLLGKFESSMDINEYDKFVKEENWDELGKFVHTAKGIAGNLSLGALYMQGVFLMDQLRGGNAPKEKDVELFREIYDVTISEIKGYLA